MARDRFRFIDNVAPSDAAFEAFGETLDDLFSAAAEAMFSVIVDLEFVKPEVERELTVISDSVESLLYDWLSELVYLKDIHREIYSQFHVSISCGEMQTLRATLRGDSVENVRGRIHTDVKAVTYHKLKVEKTENGYEGFVIVDL